MIRFTRTIQAVCILFEISTRFGLGQAADVNAEWNHQIVYQIMTDRFFRDVAKPKKAPADKATYQGGDIEGVIQKLDYIQRLGATAILLNPVTDSEAYHGYAVMDLFKINPEFGTMKNYRRLVTEAHKRGMKVLFDFVAKHASGNSKLFKEHLDWFREVKHPEAINDPDINEAWSKTTFDLLRSLKQEKSEVYTYLLKAAKQWVDCGIDGFRMDAVSLIQYDFWKKFNRDIKTYARPGFMVMGELFDSDIDRINKVVPYFDGLFDFSIYYSLNSAVKGNGSNYLKMTLDEDGLYKNQKLQHFTFIDNHDVSRFVAMTSLDTREKLLKQALAVLFTIRGVPTLLYGTEIELDNEPRLYHTKYDQSRTPMRFDKNESHPIYEFIQRLAKIRKSFDFNSKDFEFILTGNRNPALAYLIRDNKHQARFVIHNFSNETLSDFRVNLNYARGLPKNGKLENLLDSGKALEIKNGYAVFNLGPNESAIYAP